MRARCRYDALAASSNKCLEGVPGLGFVVCRNEALAECKGNATTLVLDLYDQAEAFAKTGQYRFTPPIHVIVALGQAIEEHAAEGGVAGRGGRYRDNARVLIDGMRAHGLPDAAGRQAAGADHRHLPHADRSEVRLPALLRPAEGPRLRDLSRQAHGGRLLPHRLHRPAVSASTCAARWPRCARCWTRCASATAGRPWRRSRETDMAPRQHEQHRRRDRRQRPPLSPAAPADRRGLHRRLGAGLHRARGRGRPRAVVRARS